MDWASAKDAGVGGRTRSVDADPAKLCGLELKMWL